jgi:hypothetical protein
VARSISGTDSKTRRRHKVPGIWEAERGRHLKMIEDGDPRLMHDFAPGFTDAERQAANASQHSGSSYARGALAAMDADGWIWAYAPSVVERFPRDAAVPWLADRSVRRVRVYADDSIEPTECSGAVRSQ